MSVNKSPDIPKFVKVRHMLKKKEDLTDDIKKSFYKSFSVEIEGTVTLLSLALQYRSLLVIVSKF